MGVRRSIPVILAGLTLLACTSSTTRSVPIAPTGTRAIALAPDAQRYAAIVAPVDAAIDAFEASSRALRVGASVDEFVAIARPFASTVAAVDNELRQATWPVAARHDIQAELGADKSLIADLTGTLDVTLIIGVWRQQVTSAASKVSRTKRAVSIDLGLVQPSAA